MDRGANTARSLVYWYHFNTEENMCPANYATEVDTQSWGMCSCWENGGYRSKNGAISTCRPIIPATTGTDSAEDDLCSEKVLCKESYRETETVPYICQQPRSNKSKYWCQQTVVSSHGQICPTMNLIAKDTDGDGTEDTFFCADENNTPIKVVNDDVPAYNQ